LRNYFIWKKDFFERWLQYLGPHLAAFLRKKTVLAENCMSYFGWFRKKLVKKNVQNSKGSY